LVTGGSFNRGNSATWPATLSNFRLDEFEVTVGRFRIFKAAWDGGWRPSAGAGKHTHLNSGSGLDNLDSSSNYEPGWSTSFANEVDISDTALVCDGATSTWTASAGSNERRPMNCIDWYTAHAFCIWDGGFLPSEAEWNYAAAGGGGASGQRHYPWSSPSSSTTISPTNASYECDGDGVDGCLIDDLVFVGTKTAGLGRFGHAEMSGNVSEWTLDFQNPDMTIACTDCTYISATGISRVQRGGAFSYPTSFVTTAYSPGVAPGRTSDVDGVRCARAP
jgi:formylglycine-generating enzyme required for sulfatase activity